MLILAGVSLNAMIGDNGIINSAQNAKKQSIIEDEKEKIKVLYAEALLEEDNVYKTFEKSIKKEFGDDTVVTDLLDDSFRIEKNSERKMKYVINPDGSVEDDTYKLWDGTAVAPTNKTSTEIHIYTAEELKWLANQVNSGNEFAGYTIYLENDLDLGARQKDGELIKGNKWTPIGFLDNGSAVLLKGIFDGQNHTIKGVYVNCKNYSGVFGMAHIIKNLKVRNSYFRTQTICSAGICGDLMRVGSERGLIDNCHNIGSKVIAGTLYAGGIAAYVPGAIVQNCSNSGDIISCGYIGGIAGRSDDAPSFKNCVNYGFIQSFIADPTVNYSGSTVGGIIGLSSGTLTDVVRVVENCKNFGSVCGSNKWIGGIVGINDSDMKCFLVIKDCINNASVYSEQISGRVAGIIGNGNICFAVINCINYGDVDGYGNGQYGLGSFGQAGGIVGTSGRGGYVLCCINYGKIKSTNLVGGIVGGHYCQTDSTDETVLFNEGDVERVKDCINFGEVEAVTGTSGGIFGSMESNEDYLKVYIYECLNYGTVKGVYCGGLLGGGAGSSYSVNLGKVLGTNSDGIVWSLNTNCKYNRNMSTNGLAKKVGYSINSNDVTNGAIYDLVGSTSFLNFSFGTPKVAKVTYSISGNKVSMSSVSKEFLETSGKISANSNDSTIAADPIKSYHGLSSGSNSSGNYSVTVKGGIPAGEILEKGFLVSGNIESNLSSAGSLSLDNLLGGQKIVYGGEENRSSYTSISKKVTISSSNLGVVAFKSYCKLKNGNIYYGTTCFLSHCNKFD